MPIQKISGEVAAITSCFFQHGISAIEIYNQLLENDNQWIELASNKYNKIEVIITRILLIKKSF